jgi:hypothetical protein
MAIQIKFIFPAIVIYTDKVSKGGGYVVRGKAAGPFVIIGKPYARDRGLLAHELTHVRQFWTRGLLIHTYLYTLIRKYRLHAECQCYYQQWLKGEQAEIKKQDFADRIWLFYNLKYPKDFVYDTFYSYFKEE